MGNKGKMLIITCIFCSLFLFDFKNQGIVAVILMPPGQEGSYSSIGFRCHLSIL